MNADSNLWNTKKQCQNWYIFIKAIPEIMVCSVPAISDFNPNMDK